MTQTSPHHFKTLDARCQGAPAVQVDPVAVIQVLQRELPQAREEAGRIRGQYLRLAREQWPPRSPGLPPRRVAWAALAPSRKCCTLERGACEDSRRAGSFQDRFSSVQDISALCAGP